MIVLLVVAVALGFGLSIISQSVTDTEIAGHSEESARVFNAAEAGIESALGNISAIVGLGQQTIPVGEDENRIDVNYEVTGQDFLEGDYSENDIATVVLGTLPDTLTIEWGESCPLAASLLITVIKSDNQIERYGWNACDLANDFTNVSDPGSVGYLRQKTLIVGANALVKIRPIYNQANIRVTGTGNLPPQAYNIDSEAQQPLTLEAKAIQVDRTEPATPSIFDYVLFSGTTIVK